MRRRTPARPGGPGRPAARGVARLPLATQLVIAQVALIALALVAAGAVTVEQTNAVSIRETTRRTVTTAEYLAATPTIRATSLVRNTALASAVVSVQTTADIDLALVADLSGRVVATTDPQLTGDLLDWPALLADPVRADTTTLRLAGRTYLVASAPVFSQPGPIATGPVEQIGIAVTGIVVPTRTDAFLRAVPNLLAFLGAAMLIGIAGSVATARWIKRQTLGLEPREITNLVRQRVAVLSGMADGVIALDTEDRLEMANPRARELLGLPPGPEGRTPAELGLDQRLASLLSGDGAESEAVLLREGRILELKRMPVLSGERRLGSVTTLIDRTTETQLESEVRSFRTTTELLRVQAHEFANRLHTISGLIQIGAYDEVVEFVGSLSRQHTDRDLVVTRMVDDRSIAALLIAKAAEADEDGVVLRLGPRLHLPALAGPAAFDLGTVIGNLIDNAAEAATSVAGRQAVVAVELRHVAGIAEVTVTDSGPGIPDEVRDEVFGYGFTTKDGDDGDTGSSHGLGLALCRHICDRRGGGLAYHRTEAGTVFVARLEVETR